MFVKIVTEVWADKAVSDKSGREYQPSMPYETHLYEEPDCVTWKKRRTDDPPEFVGDAWVSDSIVGPGESDEEFFIRMYSKRLCVTVSGCRTGLYIMNDNGRTVDHDRLSSEQHVFHDGSC